MSNRGGKKGGRGRGSFSGRGPRESRKGYLPEELMSHYRRVVESLEQFKDEDQVAVLEHSKSEFLTNVVSGLAEELVQVSQNQTVSTIVETVIAATSPANLRTLFVAATDDLPTMVLDRFASHVLEALILQLPAFYSQPPDSSPEEVDDEDAVPQDKVEAAFKSVCDFVDAQFEVLVTHVYGSHVFRALLEALSGVPVAHTLKKSQKSGYGQRRGKKESPQQIEMPKPPSSFKGIFDGFASRLFSICDYEVHLKDPMFSLLIQAVLMILHRTDPALCTQQCQTLLKRVADSCEEEHPDGTRVRRVPDMAQDTAGSYLLEQVFQLIDDDMRAKVHAWMLEGRVLEHAIHPTATHCLQTFIATITNRDLLGRVFDELSEHFEDVLAVGYLGLLATVAEACSRLTTRQDEFITTLMGAFHCKEPAERQKSLIKLVASFSAYEVFYSLEEGKDKPVEGAEEPPLKGPINQHGSRLIQQLLQFTKPRHAALALLGLSPPEVQMLWCDPAGSHLVEAFFSSPTVLEKNRDIFLRKLKGLLQEVACTKIGSRCLEAVWRKLNTTQRTAVARELAESQRLQNDHFGHFVYRNFQLNLFTTNKKKWQETQASVTARKSKLKDLLHKTVSEPPAKKKKKVAEEDGEEKREQKEDYIEDHVTAMFEKMKKKKQQDSSKVTAQQPLESDHTEEEATENTSPSRQKRKEKKKKAKAVTDSSKVETTEEDSEKPSTVKNRFKSKVRKDTGKAKVADDSPFESYEENPSANLKKGKKRPREELVCTEKVKKKKKRKSVGDSSETLDEGDKVMALQAGSLHSAKNSKKKQNGREPGLVKKTKKKKKTKKVKSG